MLTPSIILNRSGEGSSKSKLSPKNIRINNKLACFLKYETLSKVPALLLDRIDLHHLSSLHNIVPRQATTGTMTYVPKYPNTKRMAQPKSAIGFVWRLRMLDNRIASATDQRSRVIYRMTKSVNLLQAERRLGILRFHDICSKLGISTDPTVIEQHRRIAAGAHRMFDIAEHLPDNVEALSLVTELDSGIRSDLIRRRIINPYTSLDELRNIVRYSRAACSLDEIGRRIIRNSRQLPT